MERIKIEIARPFSEDKKIKIRGFMRGADFEVESRALHSELIIREIFCNECGDREEIRFHTKDIPILISALNTLLKLQKRNNKILAMYGIKRGKKNGKK